MTDNHNNNNSSSTTGRPPNHHHHHHDGTTLVRRHDDDPDDDDYDDDEEEELDDSYRRRRDDDAPSFPERRANDEPLATMTAAAALSSSFSWSSLKSVASLSSSSNNNNNNSSINVGGSSSSTTTLNTTTTTDTTSFGPLQSVVLLLRNYQDYGLAERVVDHFHWLQSPLSSLIPLVSTLPNEEYETTTPNRSSSSTMMLVRPTHHTLSLSSIPEVSIHTPAQPLVTPPLSRTTQKMSTTESGVVQIFEAIPSRPWQKFTRRQKNDFKRLLRHYNNNNNNNNLHEGPVSVRKNRGNADPLPLPFLLYSQTRLYTTYEVTNIAFVIDASFTLTVCGAEDPTDPTILCPLDRLVHMSRTFFQSLMEPITTSTDTTTTYQPHLAITVLAVYPTTARNNNDDDDDDHGKCTSVLVRDYHLTDDRTSVEAFCQRWIEFCDTELEDQLASRRMMMRSLSTNPRPGLSRLLQAGTVALASLSDHGRPLLVIGTDGGGGASQNSSWMDHPLDDIPVIVLDCRRPCRIRGMKNPEDSLDWMHDDHDDATASLSLSDDDEMIHQLCQSTGGAYWDDELLQLGATTRAGQMDSNSIFNLDYYFAFRKQTSIRKHSIQCNAIQWYTLFQLSQLSPRVHDDWGHLPPPRHLSPHRDDPTSPQQVASTAFIPLPPSNQRYSKSTLQQQTCTTFANYVVNPIPIHEVILMRIKEGYRAKQYGQSNMLDTNRISILFTMSLHMGITIRYELSFVEKSHSPMTGSAHIKIALAGDADLILSIKKQYLNTSATTTTPQKICNYLRSMQKEDLLQAYISPVQWTDQLSTNTTPFICRLGTLSSDQLRFHFCRNEFDCVCVGRMPWDDDDFLSEFRDNDDGSQHLIDAISAWSTQTIIEGKSYLKQTHPECGVGGYALVSIVQSALAPRLYTIAVETFSGVGARSRKNLMIAIRNVIDVLPSVEILPNQLCKSLIVNNMKRHDGSQRQFSQSVMESLQNHTSWDLVKDPELTSLLTRRRKEIGKFVLLESCENHGSFARIFGNEALADGRQDPGNLSQYHFVVLDDRVVVNLYMEFESGIFFPFREGRSQQKKFSTFHRLVASLKKRDQECGHVLRCRTLLLQAFDATVTTVASQSSELYRASVLKLIGYSSKVSISLRFFTSGIGEANDILHDLTKESLLSQSFGPKVAELPISGSTVSIDSLEVGDWFIVEYDKYTSSIVHLSNKDRNLVLPGEELSTTYRELTFYTFGISDVRADCIATPCCKSLLPSLTMPFSLFYSALQQKRRRR